MMDGDILGAALLTAVDDAIALHQNAGPAQRAEIWRRIGNAIVAHVRLASVNVTVTSVGGVTIGAGVSGPGTGSGTIL